MGDLGNVEVNTEGEVHTEIEDSLVSLTGRYSVLNRAIVVSRLMEFYRITLMPLILNDSVILIYSMVADSMMFWLKYMAYNSLAQALDGKRRQ